MKLVKLEESSVKRVEQHLANNNPMALISAYRRYRDNAENKRLDRELRMFARQAEVAVADGVALKSEFGYVTTLGSFKEDGKPVLEMSILLITDKSREKELYDFAIAMGKRYDQQGILFVPSEGEPFFESTNNDDDNWIGKIGSRVGLRRTVSRDKKSIENAGGFTQIKRTGLQSKSFGKPNDIFVFGEDFNLDEDFSANYKSLSNNRVSSNLRYCLREYGQDFLEKIYKRG